MLDNPEDPLVKAIGRCDGFINHHRARATFFLTVASIITTIFLFLLGFKYLQSARSNEQDSKLEGLTYAFANKINVDSISSIQYNQLIDKAISFEKFHEQSQRVSKNSIGLEDYLTYAVFILLFGVATSLYRYHLKESVRQEHIALAFQRIRIAGYNSSTKFDGEVNISLARDAFSFQNITPDHGAKGKTESPIPGHPASDLYATLSNKLADAFDVVLKPKE